MLASAQRGRGRHRAVLGLRFRASLVWASAPSGLGPSWPRAPAVGGHVSEDAEQELAGVAWLEGGGHDGVAALGLVRAQEDAARVDVDGAGGPVLQAVHAILAVLLHLRAEEGLVAVSPDPTPPHASFLPHAVKRAIESTYRKRPEWAHLQRQKQMSVSLGLGGGTRGWAMMAKGLGSFWG